MHEKIPRLLASVQEHASSWFASVANRPIPSAASAEELRQELGGPFPQEGIDPEVVTGILARAGMKGTVASTGPRYFSFVVGGNLPAALAADWLVSAWDQNAGIYVLSPLVSVIEEITGSWLRELAGLPPTMSFGFVTGGHMTNFTALAAARHRVLRDAGWDVEENGLGGGAACGGFRERGSPLHNFDIGPIPGPRSQSSSANLHRLPGPDECP